MGNSGAQAESTVHEGVQGEGAARTKAGPEPHVPTLRSGLLSPMPSVTEATEGIFKHDMV